MKAPCWQRKNSVSVETVSGSKIVNQKDAVIKITSVAICNLTARQRIKSNEQGAGYKQRR